MIKSAGVGTLLALLVGLLAFVLGSQTHVITAYLAPGIFVAGFVGPLIPSRLVYWLVPEGGPTAFLLITLVCSLLFWSTLFSAVHYARARVKHRAG